jgi:hypothetical protein
VKNAYVYGCSFYDVAKDYELAKKRTYGHMLGPCCTRWLQTPDVRSGLLLELEAAGMGERWLAVCWGFWTTWWPLRSLSFLAIFGLDH